MAQVDNIVEIKGLRNFLGGHWVHDGIDLTVSRGEIIAIIGASGCGKTTLLRSILRLHAATEGEIHVFGADVCRCSEAEMDRVRRRWGMMFQSGALFSSLNLLENILFPMRELLSMPSSLGERLGMLKINLVGLEPDSALKYPAELSGGMRKRGALARAIALDPELVFLDEPTAGLDPKSAEALDSLVLDLRAKLGLTFVMVTHDLDTLWRVADRVVFLGEGKVLAAVGMQEMMQQQHPLIKAYFGGIRGQARGHKN